MSTTYQRTRRIDSAEAAKMIRKTLKTSFPNTKFSVRTDRYAGGSSIRVRWTDGPTTKQVREITDHYQGSSFDPMIDLKSYHDTVHEGERVHFGCDYVFPERKFSPAFLARAAIDTCQRWGVAHVPEVKVSDYDGSGYLDWNADLYNIYPGNNSRNLGTLIYLHAEDTSAIEG